jgi:hypothetical protein
MGIGGEARWEGDAQQSLFSTGAQDAICNVEERFSQHRIAVNNPDPARLFCHKDPLTSVACVRKNRWLAKSCRDSLCEP